MIPRSDKMQKDLEDEVIEICGTLIEQGYPSKEIALCFHGIAETIELFDPLKSAEF